MNDSVDSPLEENSAPEPIVLDIGFGEILILPQRKTLLGGLRVSHYFSSHDQHPYEQCEWTRRNVTIMDYSTGKPSFSREKVESPLHWSENSVRITAAKYLYGSSPEQPQYEDSLRHAFDRIANTYTIWGWQNGYFAALEDAKAFNWELKAMLVKQIWAPNSPVWFNIGHWEQWRWGRPDLRALCKGKGNHAFKAFESPDGLSIQELDNPLERPQSSACQPAWAQVNTPQGLMTIEKIIAAFESGSRPVVISATGETPVLAVKRNGQKEIFRIRLQDGNYVEATADHVICASSDRSPDPTWKRLDEVVPGDYMRVYSPNMDKDPRSPLASEKDKAEAFLVGWNQSAGSCWIHVDLDRPRSTPIMEWHTTSPVESGAIAVAASTALPSAALNSPSGNLDASPSAPRKLRIFDRSLSSLVTKYSLADTGFARRVPSIIWASPDLVSEYLKGVFQASAKVSDDTGNGIKLEIPSQDVEWLEDLQKLLGTMGIYSTRAASLTVDCPISLSVFKSRIGFLPTTAKAQELSSIVPSVPPHSLDFRFVQVKEVVALGASEVMDIQTGTGNYLSNNVLVHNCFLTEVEDSMESILQHQVVEGRIFSSGSGVGVNISRLRSSHEPISGKGKSSGPLSFNKGWDRMAGAIKSGGKTRRAARMVLMDSDHPNTPEFIGLKNSQEDMAKIILREHNSKVALKKFAAEKTPSTPAEELVKKMIEAMPLVNEKTYDGSMDGEVYGETVSDQNANHSVSLLGDFWNAYWTNGDYSTRWVTDKSRVVETFPAKKLLRQMAESVWHNAEPGCHNNDWINLWNPVKSAGRIDTSNPCSEYLHINGTSCNLSAFNIYRFLGDGGQIDHEGLKHAARLAMIAADLNIEECGFPDPEIASGTYTYRTTGIGYGNIGGLLMALGIPYDSDEGRFLAGLLVSHLTAYCWQASSEMGRELGSYRAFSSTSKDLAEVLRLHKASHQFLTQVPHLADADSAMNEQVARASGPLPRWESLDAKSALRALAASFDKVGSGWNPSWLEASRNLVENNPWENVDCESPMRNSFVSLMQPGGTVSGPMGIYDEGTTSIEPDYTLVKYKTLSGGGTMTMFNSLALKGLRSLGYDEWHVREAALEVAGINGLIVACQGLVQSATDHLSTSPRPSEEGPVRRLFQSALAKTKETVLDIVVTLSEGKTVTLPQEVANGRGNVEGIPWLPANHQAVFDCAATLGGGTRSIAPSGHIKMLGAIQPFLSGSSSKTCNLPHSATVEDIISSFELSHKMGVKCIALYRADSKGVSVYTSDSPEAKRWEAENIFREMTQNVEAGISGIVAEAAKPRRRKLPGSRSGQIVKFDIGGSLDGFIVVGVYPDGRCGEVFGRLGQGGSFAHGMFESFCKAFSVMLQWGVSLPDAIRAFKNTAFDPSGFVRVAEGNCEIDVKSCKSVVDLMMRMLEWLFPESTDYRLRGNVTTPPTIEGVSVTTSPVDTEPDPPEALDSRRKDQLSSAEMCPECHALAVIQDGKCRRCTACGYSNGGCGA